MLSGKILHPADWFRLFQAILDAPIVEEAVLTVVSDHVSGSIGVRQGRWIMGASTSTGLKGAAAVRQLISLPSAQFGYLDAQKVKVRASINQQLQVDIGNLLNDPATPIVDNPSTSTQQQQKLPPAIKAPPPMNVSQSRIPAAKPQTPAEIATAELRKTFNQLRPVGPSYYQSQVPPPPPPTGPGTGNMPKPGQSGIRPAIPGAPPKVVSPAPKKSQSYNPWGGDEDEEPAVADVPTVAESQAPVQAPQPATPPPGPPPGAPAQAAPSGAGFEFDPSDVANENGSGRKRVNPLDKLIFGAASTCMKLTSLKQREKEQQEAAAAAAAAAQQQQQQQFQPQQQDAAQGSWADNPWGVDDGPQPQQFGKPWGAFAQLVPGQQSAPPAPPQQALQNFQNQQPGFAPPVSPQQQQPQAQPHAQQPQAQQPQAQQPQAQQPQAQQPQAPHQQPHPQHLQQQPPHPQQQQQPGFAPPAGQPFNQQMQPQNRPPQQDFAPQNEHYPQSPASPAPKADSGYVHPLEQTRRSEYQPRTRESVPEQPGPPPRPAVEPVPPQPHPHVATVMPDLVAPPLDPAQARNLVDAVRATAWRIASRVAYEAQLRMEQENDKQFNTQRLRTIEHDTSNILEKEKARRSLWPPDATTIAFAVCVVLFIGVVCGGIFIVMQQQGNSPFLSSGKRYLAQQREDLAIPQFTLALDKNPNDVDAVQLRAETYEKIKDWEHASADYAKLWELKPKHYDAARKAAYYQFKIQNYFEAQKAAKKLLAAKSDDASAQALVVMSLARDGKHAEAIKESAQVDNDLVPPYLVPDFFGSLGFAYGKTNEPKQAIASYTKALEADAHSESALQERAAAFMELKDYKKAAEDYKALATLFPGRAGNHADYAKAAMLGGDTKTAAVEYEEAIKLSPTVPYYLALAQCDMANNNFGHAVYDCDCALKLAPTSYDASHLRTEALQKAKSGKAIVIAKITQDYVVQKSTAPAALMRAAPVAVAGQDPLTQKGYQLMLSKNWQAASEVLASAIKRTPRDWSARRFFAAANMEMGRYEAAMQSFEVMAANRAILPSDEMAYAECAAKSGKGERALELYNNCLNRDPTFLEARIAMIKVCVEKGFTAKAQALVKEGSAMQPATKETLQKALAGN